MSSGEGIPEGKAVSERPERTTENGKMQGLGRISVQDAGELVFL